MRFWILGFVGLFVGLALFGGWRDPANGAAIGAAAGEYRASTEFWNHWGDGRAEISSYDLTIDRYGAKRSGTAVSIFVTENFSETDRVKADPGRRPQSDEFPVMKLNLVQDFPTGVYDYNMMTSVFTSLAPHHGQSGGAVSKVSFSSQEWCGHVYQQALFSADQVRATSHSYFGGEADESIKLSTPDAPGGAIAEESLWSWARGWAVPILAPGEAVEVACFRSLQEARLDHRPLAWRTARLVRGDATSSLTVPAGTFQVVRHRAEIEGGPTWEFWVESAAPHKIVRWTTSGGQLGEMVGSERLAYWNRNGKGEERGLSSFGLTPRPARTP